MYDFLYTPPRSFPVSFSCMAEAVASFVRDGYITSYSADGYRIMTRTPTDKVKLIKDEFLLVTAYKLETA